jgi:hypothetical protein
VPRAQIVGVIFPVFIMALVPFRQFAMPRLFRREHLQELDAAPYEEVGPGVRVCFQGSGVQWKGLPPGGGCLGGPSKVQHPPIACCH